MATLPIYLEVEDVAVGPVLIALRRMPGIIKMNLDISAGAPAPAPVARNGNGPKTNEIIIAMMMKANGEPVHVSDMARQVGGHKSRASVVLNALKKKGIVKAAGKGNWVLTPKAMRDLAKHAEPQLLPAPKPAAKPIGKAKSNGHKVIEHNERAERGTGPAALCETLRDGPLSVTDIRTNLEAKGVSGKSLSGFLDRGKRDGIIKKNASGLYELTAKGAKQSTAETQGA